MKSSSYKILQLTDMHLFGDPEEKLLGLNTQESFDAVISLAHALHRDPDMICLTGDMSQDETIPAYERLAEKIASFHCPKYWIPGNHDDREFIQAVYSDYHIQCEKHVILDSWQIIMLDSKKHNAVEGHLAQSQFDLLEESLASFPEHHALIFMHHHALPVGSHWLDNLMLINAEQFWKAIEPYKNVKLLICGHVHQEHEGRAHHVDFFSTPSTCFQFKRNSERFAVEALMPGYRLIELFPDGTYKTTVHRIENFPLNLSGEMKGY